VEGFEEKRVVVVGGGNSAVQIAFELAQVSQVSLATRKPISFSPQRILGKDLHFWLTVSGLDRFSFSKGLSTKVSVLDTGIYQEAISKKRPDARPMFSSFTEKGVVWGDGQEKKIDAVLFATGYRAKVMYLKTLQKALDSSGAPIQNKGISQNVHGLYYIGLSGQLALSSATLRGVGSDANYVVIQVKLYVKKHSPLLQ
jgi:putative flavoprotein involved in K+ transport